MSRGTTYQKAHRKALRAQQQAMVEADKTIGELARGIYGRNVELGGDGSEYRDIALESIKAAIEYFKAVQTFGQPAAPAEVPQAPVDANGSPVDE